MADEGDPARAPVSRQAVGVIGWPVEHSLSPAIHNAAFDALGMEMRYVRLPVPPGGLSSAFVGLRALGFRGANVTMPHKTESADLSDRLHGDARRLHAVNTLVIDPDGSISGYNTDAPGFDRFLRRDAGFEPEGRAALMYGAGGAARACAVALADGGLDRLSVALREPSRGEELVGATDGTPMRVDLIGFDGAPDVDADLVINATPLGAHGEALPLPRLGPGTVVVDLLYRPAVTPLRTAARDAGAAAFGGLGLLLQQAVLSFELWTGREPPIDVMSAAALAELA